MIAEITPHPLAGRLRAIPSKSEAHRALICAALADNYTTLYLNGSSEDIDATARCLNALGADVMQKTDSFCISPLTRGAARHAAADCGESGSTLRFLLPVAGALGIETDFRMHGRLSSRPLFPLDRELVRGGCRIERDEHIVHITGQLLPGAYTLPGNISSQFISGMLFALSLLTGQSTLTIEGSVESAAYIDMTLAAMARFGVRPEAMPGGWQILGTGGFSSPGALQIGGDWSNAAFWLCTGAHSGCSAEISGLDRASTQGDAAIANVLKAMGAHVEIIDGQLHCAGADARDVSIDASGIPDLIPAIAAFACADGRTTRIENAARLRLKESDRLRAITTTLNALGGNIEELKDGLVIHGVDHLRGGRVASAGDHRIAMMAAAASPACRETVVIEGAEAVNKSYPGFWRDFQAMGGKVRLRNGGSI